MTHELSTDFLANAQGVVDTVISEEHSRYEESVPPSDTLLEVLNCPNVATDLQPVEDYSDRIDFENIVAAYNDFIYTFGLIINP